jgi:hypothetical protein
MGVRDEPMGFVGGAPSANAFILSGLEISLDLFFKAL